jgi:polysaccharide pyruvyl transferase WcaK-like protein
MAMTICKMVSNHLERLLVLPAEWRIFNLPLSDLIVTMRLHQLVFRRASFGG